MKLFIILLAVLLCVCVAQAQSIFKPMPKNQSVAAFGARVAGTGADSVYNAFRPVANLAAYGEPGNVLMAGAGISYQHCTYNFMTSKWYCQWSISGMLWAGGSVAPSTPSQAVSYGVMLGVLNNLIMIGPSFNGTRLQATVAIGISLNN